MSYLHTPAVERGSWYRVDTASGTNTPTTVYFHNGTTDPIGTSAGASGSTVRDTARDDTAHFWSATQTLYLKQLNTYGAPNGTVVTSVGVTPPADPTGAPVDIATIAAAVAALPTTYAPKFAATGTATLSSGTVTVTNASITADSVIRVANKTIGGTPGALYISAKTAGVSFAITSSSGTDTSVVQYDVVTF